MESRWEMLVGSVDGEGITECTWGVQVGSSGHLVDCKRVKLDTLQQFIS